MLEDEIPGFPKSEWNWLLEEGHFFNQPLIYLQCPRSHGLTTLWALSLHRFCCISGAKERKGTGGTKAKERERGADFHGKVCEHSELLHQG